MKTKSIVLNITQIVLIIALCIIFFTQSHKLNEKITYLQSQLDQTQVSMLTIECANLVYFSKLFDNEPSWFQESLIYRFKDSFKYFSPEIISESNTVFDNQTTEIIKSTVK